MSLCKRPIGIQYPQSAQSAQYPQQFNTKSYTNNLSMYAFKQNPIIQNQKDYTYNLKQNVKNVESFLSPGVSLVNPDLKHQQRK